MADLTLERIAELRVMANAPASQRNGVEFWSAMTESAMQLLDAAARGLTQDRKAAAFDFLCGLRYIDVLNDGWATMHCDDSVSSDGATLLDCVEMAMREHEQLPQAKGET